MFILVLLISYLCLLFQFWSFQLTEEIHPYVQQDIGPLGLLPYSHPTSVAEDHNRSSNDQFSFTSFYQCYIPHLFLFPPTLSCCYTTFFFPLQINTFIVSKMICNK